MLLYQWGQALFHLSLEILMLRQGDTRSLNSH